MYHLIYVSSAVNLLSDADLRSILEASRRNNTSAGITGMLLYVEGNFIQLLEGARDDVLATHERIAGDTRHRGLITLMEGEVAEREFSDWSMGFRKVERSDTDTWPGYNDFLNKSSDAAKRKSAALMLLDNFRNINR